MRVQLSITSSLLFFAFCFSACNDSPPSQEVQIEQNGSLPTEVFDNSLLNEETLSALEKYPLKLLIPLYIYPTLAYNEYDTLIRLKEEHPQLEIVAIMNPSNGDFSSIDPNYARAISLLDDAGIKTIGYLYTLYTGRSLEILQTNIDAWKEFYQDNGISGFFLDEASSKKKDIAFYEELSHYAREQGFETIVLNPGTYVDQQYFASETFNIIVTVENSFENYNKYDPNVATQTTQKALLFYSTQKQNGVYEVCNFALEGGYKYIYATDNDTPQRWDTLSNYIDESIVAISQECEL